MPTDRDPEPARPRWAAVVVNYEAGPLLADCVRSVLADTSAGPVELVVVDNGSRDGSVETLLAAHPDVRVVRAPGNVGYARAANLGTAATKAPIVAVLNPDTEVEPGSRGRSVDLLVGEPRLGAAGPRLRNLDGSDYPSARMFPTIADAVGHGLLGLWWPKNRFTARYRQLDADPAVPRLVDWVSGAAIWLRRGALDEVGGLGRALLHVPRGHRPLLATAARRLGRRVRAVGRGRARAGRQRVAPARTGCCSSITVRRGGSRRSGSPARAALLPFAAVYFALRAVMAMGEHACRGAARPEGQ